ncbi:LysR family transcriptional regulator [Streptomyces capparidis]
MPRLDQLRSFLAVYRAGTVTGAAKEIGLSQSALTAQLAALEARLGRPLFERTARGVLPTDAAHDLARRIGEPMDQLLARLDDMEPPGHGTVRLGGPAELLGERVLPALTGLAGPGLRLRVSFGLADDLLDRLARGEHDLVVSSVRPRRPGMVAAHLADEEFVLVGTPGHLESVDPGRLAAEPVAALAHLPLVAYDSQLPVIRRYWRTEFGRRPPNETVLTVPDLREVARAARAGAGVTVLPRYIAADALRDGALVPLHRPAVRPLNSLFLVTRTGTPPNPALEAVRRKLLERAATWHDL